MHLGTLLSILIFYYNDIKKLLLDAIINKNNSRKYIRHIIVSIIPILIVGLFFKDDIEMYYSVNFLKYMYLLCGLVLVSTYIIKIQSTRDIISLTAFIIGIAQIFALLPGLSRSGITISVAMLLGISNKEATKFSFLMAIPLLFGAGFLEFISITDYSKVFDISLLFAFISSFLTGYLVINWLLKIISKGKFYLFSIYCFTLSFILFIK